MGKNGCCGGKGEGCACESEMNADHTGHSHVGHDHEHSHNHTNPFDGLDDQTQMQIQELQMLEQNFQQLLMEKNAFSMEEKDVDVVLQEVGKTSSDVFRIVGGQVLIKTTKAELLSEMEEKKKFLAKRMSSIVDKEKNFSERINGLREEILKKIQK